MFRRFFTSIHNRTSMMWNHIKSSKVVRIARKVIKKICSLSVIVTAFNVGNIMEAVSHMSDSPVSFADSCRWMIAMCGNWISSIKEHNITWDVKRIFFPLVIAASYVGGKITKRVISIFNFIKSAIKAKKEVESKAKANTDVVDVFA